MWDGYKFAIDPDTNSLYAAQITSNNYLSGITSSDYFRVSQQVFLVSSLTDLSAVTTSGAGLYFDNNGQSQYFDGANWIDTSSEVVTELTSNANNDTIPTTKAVYDYVNQEILKIQTGNSDISQLLSGKADKFYVDEQDKDVLIAAKVYTNEQISGKADKYYVDEQDKGVLSAAKAYTNEQISGKADKSDLNGLASETYVLSSINTALTSSIKAIGTVATSADLPTTAAINDLYFVGPTNNKYTEFLKTVNGWEEFGTVNDIDLSNYATCSYVDEQVSGKIDKSIIDSQITDNSTDLTLPTSKAVYDFVKDNKVKLVIDLHGADHNRDFDVEFGTMNNLTADFSTIKELEEAFKHNGIVNIEHNNPFKGGAITQYLYNCKDVEVIQLEINGRLRDVNNIECLERFCNSLVYFIEEFVNYE